MVSARPAAGVVAEVAAVPSDQDPVQAGWGACRPRSFLGLAFLSVARCRCLWRGWRRWPVGTRALLALCRSTLHRGQ